ncbi:MAG: cytosine deaminase [Leptolyngbya foveolarum]|uniref:Cytosine deaminase n=1 Tax=Leptolyngbya foveolarum TaxID=47253 RepID=A0A2W4V367_9CYAN|nr:MAG: cytosine deaminase [Leptolyngbya foveolarum]
MTTSFLQIAAVPHYWLCDVRVPRSLLSHECFAVAGDEHFSFGEALPTPENLAAVDIEIREGKIISVQAMDSSDTSLVPSINAGSSLVWPCFVDMHTHLDKGHIWPRSPNPDGTFDGALETVRQDSSQRWDFEDVYRRAEFGLKCSYAHGTQAIRTHLDAFDGQGEISFEVFRALRDAWRGKIALQAVCLVTLDYFLDKKGEKLADLVAESGGVLGGVAFMNADIVAQIDRVFELAMERGLDLDFHTDESLDPDDITLRLVAQAAVQHQFEGRITCGHCCSLSVQSEAAVRETVAAVKAANVSVVSLPMCNLYLQNRRQGRSPRYRGVTILRELAAADVKCAIASDNCRDPFFAYGDHDGLEVFTQSARIGHLDHPIGDWPRAVTRSPAEMMGLDNAGLIGEGMPADLVMFKARSFNELMARGQRDRVVIRNGKQIDTTLPDYAELDDLMR